MPATRLRPVLAGISLGAVLLAGCGDTPDPTTAPPTPTTSAPTTSAPTTSAPQTSAPTTTTPAEATPPPVTPKATAERATPPPEPPAEPRPDAEFEASVSAVTAELVPHSHRKGCPVALSDLRLITMPHHDFDGGVSTGRLVVRDDAVDAVVTAFESMFEAGVKIERMRLVDDYEGSDPASMAANNTSAYNCRTVPGTDRWSEHSAGRAVDINPVQNPWVQGDQVDPPAGRDYLDRSAKVTGLIRAGDTTVKAFDAVGWEWGGNWNSSLDYQHFSAAGR